MSVLTDLYDAKLGKGELTPDADQQNAIRLLDQLAEVLTHYKPKRKASLIDKLLARPREETMPKGYYLFGGVGRGKSMIMDMFFDAAPVDKKRRVHFHAFMLEVHDFLHGERVAREVEHEQNSIDGYIDACADMIAEQSTLLCFDEFQVKDVADAMILGRLFTALFDRGVIVVMTSNIAPENLYEDGLQRDRFLPFIALLQKRLHVFLFAGETDYRLGRLRDLKVYFWPDDADAQIELDKIFKTVSDGRAGEAIEIPVKGRVIHVPRAAKEVAAFTFEELCGEAKSALDYLELVKKFRVFVISNVPKLSDDRKDATVRFITLIDTLYDHHAFVVISAAAAPDKLYKGEDNVRVFERTVSRLMEMQSRSYKHGPSKKDAKKASA